MKRVKGLSRAPVPAHAQLNGRLRRERNRIAGALGFALACCLLAGCGPKVDEPPPPVVQELERQQVDFPGTRQELANAQEPGEAFGTVATAEASGDSTLPVYELKLNPRSLATMEQTAHSNETVPGTFEFGGVSYEGVKVRYRGAWARTWPKKPIKIFFDKENRFENQRCLNLNSGWRDPAMVRECLAYQVYAACGAPAPRSRMVRLNINGRFYGLYVQVEQPDQGFVQYLNMKGAASYKADSRSNQADERDLGTEARYRQHYEKQTANSEGFEDLQAFCKELAQTKDPVEFFNRTLDVEKYIDYLAASVLVQNWDGYNKNHYLIRDRRGSQKWLVVPWDLDRTFGDHWEWSFDRADLPILLGTRRYPGVTGWNRLQERFLSVPQFRARFFERLAELLEKEFTPEKLFPVLDKLEADIAKDEVLDRRHWHKAGPSLRSGIGGVKRFIERRRAFVRSELAALRP